MSNLITVSVSKSKASSNGGFILTLVEKGESSVVSTPLGDAETSKVKNTYYTKVVSTPPADGTVVELDLDMYDLVLRDFTTEKEQDIDLKWLYLKK